MRDLTPEPADRPRHRRIFIDRVRTVEHEEFRAWFRATNARRTRVVGFVLAAFGVLGLALRLVGLTENDLIAFYLTGTFLTAVGALLISLGLRDTQPIGQPPPHVQPLRQPVVVLIGEILTLGTAITWMFVAVSARVEVGYGLAEFIIGVLGLALLRFMRPWEAAVTFPVLAGLYWWVLAVYAPRIDVDAVVNGFVFVSFALMWSVSAYNGRVTTFRNGHLLDEINRQNEQLRSIALQDSLTGIPNRRYFDQIIETRWATAERQEEPQALCLLDIDDFKRYNDEHGHPAGDACLQRVGRLLTAALGREGVCSRLGGEEFAIVFGSLPLERCVEAVRRMITRVRADGVVTISGGIAVARPSRSTTLELYEAADRALYRAKESGRDRFVVADPVS